MIYLIFALALIFSILTVASKSANKESVAKNLALFAEILKTAEPLQKKAETNHGLIQHYDSHGIKIYNIDRENFNFGRIINFSPTPYGVEINHLGTGTDSSSTTRIAFNKNYSYRGGIKTIGVKTCDIRITPQFIELLLKDAGILRVKISISAQEMILAARLYKHFQQLQLPAVAA